MNDLSKSHQPYEIEDLLQFTYLEFQGLDSRVTSANGRPRTGDRVVITNTAGRDVSVALNDFEVEALLLRLDTAFPEDRCNLHRPYRNGRRLWVDSFAPCRCTKVFSTRLLANRVCALANAVSAGSKKNVQLAREMLAEVQAM